MLDVSSAVLVVIDFQEKLLPKIARHEEVLRRALRLIRAVRLMGLPILWTEQYPKGLGRTVVPAAEALEGLTPIEKTAFGCMGSEGFSEALRGLGRRQLLIAGVETHVCVLQTALGALEQGFEAYIARDAVSARDLDEHTSALARMEAAGAVVATSESAIFELLRDASSPMFKEVLPLLK